MTGRVSASDPVEELSLNVQQQSWRSDTEHFVVEPVVTQLLLDHDQPGRGVLGCPKYKQ